MLRDINISNLVRKSSALIVGLGFAAFSFAGVSMPSGDGDGDGKSIKATVQSHFNFSPVKANDGLFTLKAGPFYRNNLFSEETKAPAMVSTVDLLTYQKGNMTYVLPYRHKVFLTGAKSNLQAVNVKVNLNK